MTAATRTARLVLVSRAGELIGTLSPIPVATPWWQDIAPVVRAAREYFGIHIVVLRLIDAELAEPPGGGVTYLAEVAEPVAPDLLTADGWAGELDEEPLRHSYARPGGPAADVAWAVAVLSRRGMRLSGPPEQIRTWNLSSVWRLPLATQDAWLKVVPPFMVSEGELLVRMAGAPVPSVLGHDGGRCLSSGIPGTDLYDAPVPQLLRMVSLLVDLQVRWSHDLDDLFAARLPDWRRGSLTEIIADVVERTSEELTNDDVRVLDGFVDELPQRFDSLAACGLPDTLVHGDFHPGNFRGDDQAITLLDWGDSGVGHPLLDQAAFLDRIPEAFVAPVRSHWLGCGGRRFPEQTPSALQNC